MTTFCMRVMQLAAESRRKMFDELKPELDELFALYPTMTFSSMAGVPEFTHPETHKTIKGPHHPVFGRHRNMKEVWRKINLLNNEIGLPQCSYKDGEWFFVPTI